MIKHYLRINLANPHEHGLQTPREERVFTAQPKIQSQSQIFRYGRSIFCLPHQPNFSDILDLCLHLKYTNESCVQGRDSLAACKKPKEPNQGG